MFSEDWDKKPNTSKFFSLKGSSIWARKLWGLGFFELRQLEIEYKCVPLPDHTPVKAKYKVKFCPLVETMCRMLVSELRPKCWIVRQQSRKLWQPGGCRAGWWEGSQPAEQLALSFSLPLSMLVRLHSYLTLHLCRFHKLRERFPIKYEMFGWEVKGK